MKEGKMGLKQRNNNNNNNNNKLILKSKLLWIISAWFFSIIFIYKILIFVHGKEDFLPQDSQYLIQTSSNETSRKEDILTTPNCFDALASKVIGWCYHSLR